MKKNYCFPVLIVTSIFLGTTTGILAMGMANTGYSGKNTCNPWEYYICDTAPSPHCPFSDSRCFATSVERGMLGDQGWRFYRQPGRACDGVCLGDFRTPCIVPPPANSCEPLLP